MPKKFAGENSKAAAARARKSAVKEAEVAKKQKDVEDTYWKDDNKHILKKQQRKVLINNMIPFFMYTVTTKIIFVGTTRA